MPATEAELVEGIRKAYSESNLEEDESEPYKHKYGAADLLRQLLGERAICPQEPAASPDGSSDQPSVPAAPLSVQQAAASGAPAEAAGSSDSFGSQPTPEAQLAAAAARIRCGLILLETDLLADGEASVMAGLPALEKSPEAFLAWLLESYNALGLLYSDRGDMPVALSWLKRAEELYQQITRTDTKHAHLAALPLAGETSVAAADDTSATADSGSNGGEQDQHHHHQQQDGGQQEQGVCVEGAAAVAAGGAEPEERPAAAAAAARTEPEPGGGGSGGGDAVELDAAARVPGEEPEAQAGPESGDEDGAAAEAGATAAAEAGATAAAEAGGGAEEQSHDAAAAAGAAAAAPPLAAQLPENDADAVQTQYTRTLFYLAQVHGHMKASDRSALYCAATLYRQLASGKYDLDTWVNNCLQLGGYYAKVHAYGLAMYCHAAAQAVVDRDTAAGAVLGEDIAANVKLATARLYGMRLAASHSKHVEGKELEMHYPDVSYFPDYLRFSGLSVPSPDSFPWGADALAASFEEARELLNKGMPYFKDALSYYQLDGWVTDHVGILMDMSNMYRCLAGFEADPARAAAMHRCRAQLLEPLSGALNPDHFLGLSRSIDLELAHVFREISDVRELQGGQAGKVASAAASATKHYHRFLHSFTAPDTGALPGRIDPDNEPYFLMASFGLGRMLPRMKGAAGGPGGKAEASFESMLVAAHQHLRWTSEYVTKHGLESWTQEAQAAEELSELLVEQMRLRAMAAARSGGRR